MNQSAERALQLLEYLADAGPSSLAAIAKELDLNKSTAYRFVNALVRQGYARQDPDTRTYALSFKVMELSAKVMQRIDLRAQVRPVLEATAEVTGETAHLAVLEDFEVVYVDKVEGAQAVRMAARIGSRGVCHSTSLGKALLAGRPEDDWDRYLAVKDLVRRTPQTITSPAAFREELRRVRGQGFAVDNVENEEGIRCMAAPVRDHAGRVVAAMSISGWTVSMTPERVPVLAPVIVAQAAAASRSLGYAGDGEPAPRP